MATIILFNKPFQVLSQFKKVDDKLTLSDFLGKAKVPEAANCYPAGRLDFDSEGLLLLTDSGELQHRISHPDHKLEKCYWVQVEGVPTDASLQKLRSGIALKDGPCAPAKVKQIKAPDIGPRSPAIRQRANIPTCWLEIKISEGRNRQVRRMTAAIGYPTLRLIRYAIGDWCLENLASGEYRIEAVHIPKNTKK